MSLHPTRVEMEADDGCRLEARRWGEGPPLVLIHGGPGGSGRYWYEGIPALGHAFDVHALDLRGHGRSERRPPYTLQRLAQDVLAYLETQGLEDVSLLGHSFGGCVALEAALSQSRGTEGTQAIGSSGAPSSHARRRIGRLLLIGAFASAPRLVLDHEAWWTRARLAGTIAALNVRRRLAGNRVGREALMGLLTAAAPLMDDRPQGPWATHVAPVLVRSVVLPLEAAWALQPELARWDVRERLKEIDIPVLAAAGAHDRFGLPPLETFAEHLRDVDTVVVPGAGHAMFLDAPQLFLELVGTWCTTQHVPDRLHPT